MGKGFMAAVFCLLLLNEKAVASGWYQVENYEGSIGPDAVHLSLQKYDFGSGITVEGSYFHDVGQSPVAIYGKTDGLRLALCEVTDEKDLDRIFVTGSKTPIDTTGCPFSLKLGENGATGSWSKGAEKYPIALKKVASLDDTGDGKIDGPVEIPFWAQTATDRFAGIYTKSNAGFDVGICMTKLRVIDKKKNKVVQEIGFKDPDCNAGMLMTPIYMNVQKWVEGGKDVISVNFRGGGAGSMEDYGLSPKTGKYHKLEN